MRNSKKTGVLVMRMRLFVGRMMAKNWSENQVIYILASCDLKLWLLFNEVGGIT